MVSASHSKSASWTRSDPVEQVEPLLQTWLRLTSARSTGPRCTVPARSGLHARTPGVLFHLSGLQAGSPHGLKACSEPVVAPIHTLSADHQVPSPPLCPFRRLRGVILNSNQRVAETRTRAHRTQRAASHPIAGPHDRLEHTTRSSHPHVSIWLPESHHRTRQPSSVLSNAPAPILPHPTRSRRTISTTIRPVWRWTATSSRS